jgi:putative ABC transport system permease protein
LIISARAVLLALILAFASVALFCGPFLMRLRLLSLDQLLNHSQPQLPALGWRRDLLAIAVALILFLGLSAWLLSSLAIVAVLAAALSGFAALAGFVLPWAARGLAEKRRLVGMNRVVLLGLSRPRLLLALVWLGLGWAAAVGSAIPNLYNLAKAEMRIPTHEEMPQLFAININESELADLGKAVADAGGSLRHASPLILGRLLKINGSDVAEGWIARHPVRLTYRENLADSERIAAGQPLAARAAPGTVPGISVAKDFANDNGLKIGDEIEFDISGAELKAIVRNFREIRWTSFQPNFFLQFGGGVLEEFPKSFVATIYGLPENKIFAAQADLAGRFPGLSLLNMAIAIDKLTEVVGKLAWPVFGITSLALLVTAFLIWMLARHQTRERLGERRLFAMIGATGLWQAKALQRETWFWSGSAIFFGLLTGNLMSWVCGEVLFDMRPEPNWPAQILVGVAGILISHAATFNSVYKVR